MQTAAKNKNRRKPVLDLGAEMEMDKKINKQKLVPGKSLEQIRREALEQLREMGILF